ncbi:MAG: LysM peptidoglycan-binding domain-containing protein [Rickettsiales bacterium]|jgi:hypothetical protein|nr:LysM peptidoglycan-binding domain-containing protein [Rickettsiales bacterium]
MEKKEPILSAHGAAQDAESKPAAAAKNDRKSLRERIGSRFTDRQKRFILAIRIGIVVVGVMIWTILLFTREKPNAATIEPAKKIEKTEPAKKDSWWSRLFSGKKSPKAEPKAPSFDIVRMEKGEVVAAGQANPGDVVHILDNGVEIGTETADENGQWAFIPKKPLPLGNRKLSLFVVGKDGKKIASEKSAILHVTAKGSDEVAVLMGGKSKSRVMKAPKGQNIGSLRVEKIDYAESGPFRVEGRAAKGATVNVYLNNKIIGKSAADNSGAWSVEADGISLSGKAQAVRADQLDAKGKVARRVEYKFAPVFIDGEGSMVVIKKGDCLWNLALREYGKGTSYVVIFEANKSQIKNPDLIYVGQVFSVPKKDGESYRAIRREYDAKARKKKKAK